jgi:hypothetical protein
MRGFPITLKACFWEIVMKKLAIVLLVILAMHGNPARADDNDDGDDVDPPTSHGYVCTQDCSGHEAGYQWAEENGITDPRDCGGNSDSFIEGCIAYTEDFWEEEEHDIDAHPDYED